MRYKERAIKEYLYVLETGIMVPNIRSILSKSRIAKLKGKVVISYVAY